MIYGQRCAIGTCRQPAGPAATSQYARHKPVWPSARPLQCSERAAGVVEKHSVALLQALSSVQRTGLLGVPHVVAAQ